MRDVLDAPRHEYFSQDSCRVSYYLGNENQGRQPLLLIHSINAAPSAHEMKPLFEHYRKQRVVYAIDLPGFGSSDRDKRVYSPEFYASVINEFLVNVICQPCDVICFSTSSEFVAIAATHDDRYMRSVVMISPTGFGLRKPPSGPIREYLRLFLSAPPLGDLVYKLLTSKKSIRYYLNRNFVTHAPEEMVEDAYMTSHQPGAKHAPFYFLSLQLFTSDIYENFYMKLTMPVLVLFDQDPNVSFDLLPNILNDKKNWRQQRIQPTLGIPQWECPEKTFKALENFWEEVV